MEDQADPVETDDALAFCRADGMALVSESGSVKSFSPGTETEPLLEPLHNDPRWNDLQRRVGLPL